MTEPLTEQIAHAVGASEVLRTERGGHATELVASASDADRIYVFSGDGGFNEALNGSDGRIPLGFLPGGGTSVLPRALGLPRDPVEAARRLAAGRTRRISLGRANGRRFGFAAGVGLDAELVRRMDARGRDENGRRPGDLVFAWTAVKTLAESRLRFEPVLADRGTRTRLVRPRRQRGSLQLRRPAPAAASSRRPDRRRPRSARTAFLSRALSAGSPQLPPHRAHAPAARAPPRRRPDRDPLRRADAAPARRGGPRRRHRGRVRGRARRRLCSRVIPSVSGSA